MALGVILRSFTGALGQLGDSRFRRVLLLGVGLSLALLIAATAGFAYLVGWITPENATLPGLGEVHWLDDVLSWGALLLLLGLSVFLMIPVASAISSMFLDDVADAVEEVHYPALPAAHRLSLGDSIRDAVNFLGVLVGANLLALVLYLLFTPAAPFIFWGLNGFLLGREYFTLAALRRHDRAEAKRLRRRHAGTIWMAGVLMAVPLSVPLINLLVPILGAATFTHLYHALVPHSDAASLRYPQR
ncbi:EI24 domain-containing protein [Sulfitobacter sp. S0837]|uniref:EI24 domain-containing protein n=1 Tax=Sulfitobacter maritimus TaxID=2741719 RepID=UPI00158231FD|nr:EI24 domain-containing protein [Sulfitobacter maritimus]NUH63838.1 EI24 domain-containing protein [Sulfitobacter maritimus]